MENLANYSDYVIASYIVSGLVLSGLAVMVILKFSSTQCRLKKFRNEKSA